MKQTLLLAAISGFLAVVLGAFGAHGLKNVLDAHQLEIWQKGVEYQFYHSFALLAVAMLQHFRPSPKLGRAAVFFALGILFFSGSLYLLACANVLSLQGLTGVLGPITPIGGLCFLVGWAHLAWSSLD